MRHVGFVLGAIVLFAAGAGAQTSPAVLASGAQNTSSDAPAAYALYAVASLPAIPAPAVPSLAEPAQPAAPASLVQSVFQTYDLQAYAGYTFFRFYAEPKFTNDMNGINLGITYYPGGGWIGVDGDFIGTFGSTPTCTTKFVMASGGPRFRWLGPRGIEVWAHGLVGYSNFLPQTALGNHSAFAFQAGAGVDLNIRQQRWAIRLAGDVIGTRYFSTGQYSPKVSAGLVYKF